MSRPFDRRVDSSYESAPGRLRQEIAMRAARLIAEEGLDYQGAKRRAARELLGHQRVPGEIMPDNAAVELEVRAYQELFQADTQPTRLAALRRLALQLMELLAGFSPYLTGAVLNGTAGEHTDIYLQLFCDSAKDVEIFLLNQGIEFDVDETGSGGRFNAEETIHFLWPPRRADAEGIHVSVYGTDQLRGALAGDKKRERANIDTVRLLFGATEIP